MRDSNDERGHFWIACYIFAIVVTFAGVYRLITCEPSASQPPYLFLIALAAIALPFAQKLKIGKQGLEFERIREERKRAESAAEEAAIYLGVTMVMGARFGSTFEGYRALLRVLDRAVGGDPIVPHDLTEVFGCKGDYTEDRQRGDVEILGQLAQVGILEINGDGLDVTATIPAERREVVKRAVAPFLTDEAPDKE